jgi:hypothetical protein
MFIGALRSYGQGLKAASVPRRTRKYLIIDLFEGRSAT